MVGELLGSERTAKYRQQMNEKNQQVLSCAHRTRQPVGVKLFEEHFGLGKPCHNFADTGWKLVGVVVATQAEKRPHRVSLAGPLKVRLSRSDRTEARVARTVDASAPNDWTLRGQPHKRQESAAGRYATRLRKARRIPPPGKPFLNCLSSKNPHCARRDVWR